MSRRARFKRVCVAILMACVYTKSEAVTYNSAPRVKASDFSIFDGTLYFGKRGYEVLRLRRAKIIYGGQMWHSGENLEDLPPLSRLRDLAIDAQRIGEVTVIDIEHWSLDPAQGRIEESIDKYGKVLKSFKAAAPNAVTGYFGFPPIGAYWKAIASSDSPEFRDWQKQNNLLSPITSNVDALFPSLYTYYADQDGWRRFAEGTIAEARRCGRGRPVYVFLWPQYHDSNLLLHGKYLSAAYWRLQLETARRLADGIVIWGGWDLVKNKPMKWDENALWWRETVDFMKREGITTPAAIKLKLEQ